MPKEFPHMQDQVLAATGEVRDSAGGTTMDPQEGW